MLIFMYYQINNPLRYIHRVMSTVLSIELEVDTKLVKIIRSMHSPIFYRAHRYIVTAMLCIRVFLSRVARL